MRISRSKSFILFHIPRTGVSSVIRALDDELFVHAAPTKRNKLMSKLFYFVGRPLEQTYLRTHETALHVSRLLPAETFAELHKIAFVRNPYSWLVSLYELVLQSPSHRYHPRVSLMPSFGDYVDWEVKRAKRAQHRYLLGRRDEWLVDSIGRFERLTEDTQRIFRSIDVDVKPLPRVGQFTRKDYREFYDPALRRKVKTHWARDLELFGYDFEGPSSTEVSL